MAGHKPMEKKRKKMMYGRTPMKKGKMMRYGLNHGGAAGIATMEKKKKKKMMYGRKPMKGGSMSRYGLNDGGPAVMASMENQKPN